MTLIELLKKLESNKKLIINIAKTLKFTNLRILYEDDKCLHLLVEESAAHSKVHSFDRQLDLRVISEQLLNCQVRIEVFQEIGEDFRSSYLDESIPLTNSLQSIINFFEQREVLSRYIWEREEGGLDEEHASLNYPERYVEKAKNDICKEEGCTPLFVAISLGEIEKVKEILSKPADSQEQIKYRDNSGNNAVLTASYYGREEIFDLLISETKTLDSESNSLHLDVRNNKGRTPFLEAVCGGELEFIKHLQNKYPDRDFLKEKDNDAKGAIELAHEYGHPGVSEFLRSRRKSFLYRQENSLDSSSAAPIQQPLPFHEEKSISGQKPSSDLPGSLASSLSEAMTPGASFENTPEEKPLSTLQQIETLAQEALTKMFPYHTVFWQKKRERPRKNVLLAVGEVDSICEMLAGILARCPSYREKNIADETTMTPSPGTSLKKTSSPPTSAFYSSSATTSYTQAKEGEQTIDQHKLALTLKLKAPEQKLIWSSPKVNPSEATTDKPATFKQNPIHEIGSVYWKQGQSEEARKYRERALEILAAIGCSDSVTAKQVERNLAVPDASSSSFSSQSSQAPQGLFSPNKMAKENKATIPAEFLVPGNIGKTLRACSLSSRDISVDAYTEIVKKAREEKAINSKAKNGKTALHFAIEGKQFERAKILIIEGKADINLKNRLGKTAFDLAKGINWPGVIPEYFREILELLTPQGMLAITSMRIK